MKPQRPFGFNLSPGTPGVPLLAKYPFSFGIIKAAYFLQGQRNPFGILED
jgi:hypothetical protein